ncbi:hypothetical protein ACFL0L_03495, partial [Patescibacteria group bacterium]
IVECTRDQASEGKVTVNVGDGSKAWIYVDAEDNKAIWVPMATAQKMMRELGIETGPANVVPFETLSPISGSPGNQWRIDMPEAYAGRAAAAVFLLSQLGNAIAINDGPRRMIRFDPLGRLCCIIGPKEFCTSLLDGSYFENE